MIAFTEERSFLVVYIWEHQFDDEKLYLIQDKVILRGSEELILDYEGIMRIGGRICVPEVGKLIILILREALCFRCLSICVQ